MLTFRRPRGGGYPTRSLLDPEPPRVDNHLPRLGRAEPSPERRMARADTQIEQEAPAAAASVAAEPDRARPPEVSFAVRAFEFTVSAFVIAVLIAAAVTNPG